MKRLVLVGTVMVLTAMLMFSCYKDRYNYENLESVHASGQWKLPIGTASVTLEQVMEQLTASSQVEYVNIVTGENGDFYVSFRNKFEAFNASQIWSVLNNYANFRLVLPPIENNLAGMQIPDSLLPLSESIYCHQEVILNELNNNTEAHVSIEKLHIKSCVLSLLVEGNLANITSVVVSSPDIHKESDPSDTLTLVFDNNTGFSSSLADYVFNVRDYSDMEEPYLRMNYVVNYDFYGSDEPQYNLTLTLGFRDIVIGELSGYVDRYIYEFDTDTAFSLPLGNLSGELSLLDAKLRIDEVSTFRGLVARLEIDKAQLHGEEGGPTFDLFDGPHFFEVNEHSLIEETLDFTYNTEFNAVHLAGVLDLNPEGFNRLISIYDTSSVVVDVDAMVPFKFNSAGVTYSDTINFSLPSDMTSSYSEMEPAKIIKEVKLHINVDSRLPINLSAQLYTIDATTGQVSDALLPAVEQIKGKFDDLDVNPKPVTTSFVISITQDKLDHFMKANRIKMDFGLDTNSQDIVLNSRQGLGITLKIDVIYEGDINLE